MSDKKKFDREKFIKKLDEKGVNKECQRCGHKTFSLIDGYSFMPINETTGNILGGPAIPAILVVCNNCGSINLHALGALEQLDKNEENGQ
ncbi:MAG: hypothetical protein C0412_18760 [Flavobacterium sp.]|nr:hypothetical protein [Flavobacterium sp.]